MRRSEAREVVKYYYSIGKIREILQKGRREVEREYCGLRSTCCGDVLGGGGDTHRTTEDMAARTERMRLEMRIQQIDIKICVLDADEDKIRSCMDGINGKYQKLLDLRYRMGCSWAGVAGRLSTTERSAKRWADRAMDRIAEAMKDVPMVEELIERAIWASE